MADIHFVWWGNPPTSDDALMGKAADTPNALATLLAGAHTVHYWRQPGAFNPRLNGNIEVHELDDPSSLLSGTLAWAGNGIRMNAIVDALSKYRALAAVKDLISYAIMNKHGGFFFDTTTKLTGANEVTLRRILGTPPDGPRAPFYPMINGATGKTMIPDDDGVDYTMSYPIGIPPGARTVQVPNFDVWALYSPAGHQVFNVALNSYLDRCMNFGLNKHPGVASIGKRNIDTIMTQEDRTVRNFVIAGLSTTSIMQGLYTHAKQAGKKVSDLGWQTVKKDGTNGGTTFANAGTAQVFVPDLGLHKVFGSSWR